MRSSAFSVASMLRPPMRNIRDRIPKLSTIAPSASFGAFGITVSVIAPVTGSVVVVVVVPVELLKLAPLPNALWKPWSPLPLTKPLMPRSFSAPRLISEKRTSSMTCWAEPICSRLMTLPGA